MDSKIVAIISVKNCKDCELSNEQKREGALYKSWLSKMAISNDGLLISSPISECHELSTLFSSEFLPVTIVPGLNPDKSLHYYSYAQDISDPIPLPSMSSPFDLVPLLDYISANCSYGILVIEEETFRSLEQDSLVTRINTGSSFSELKLVSQKNSKKAIYEQSFNQSFLEQFNLFFNENTNEIASKFNEININIQKIPNETNYLAKNVKGSVYEKQTEFCDKLVKIDQALARIDEEVQAINGDVDQVRVLADLYLEKVENTQMIEIVMFYYDYDCDKIRVKVRNTTDEVFKQVDVFFLETRQRVCNFQVVQPGSSVLKLVDGGFNKDFYINLVAICNNQVISEIFTVFPFYLGFNKNRLGYDMHHFKVKNLSQETASGLILVSINGENALKSNFRDLEYKQVEYFSIPNSEIAQTEIFLVYNRMKASNSLYFR